MDFGWIGGIFNVIFLLFFVAAVFEGVRFLCELIKKENSQALTVNAIVISKRKVIGNNPPFIQVNDVFIFDLDLNTFYYIKFQVEGGEKIELWVSEREYNILLEGDKGKLTFQGNRYLSFVR